VNLNELRTSYHSAICREIIRLNTHEGQKYVNYSDGSSKASIEIGFGIAERINCVLTNETISGQTKGASFESVTSDFLQQAFSQINHLRPGNWNYSAQNKISKFVQYSHLADLDQLINEYKTLAAILGQDYIIKPDIIISRELLSDEEINISQPFVVDSQLGNKNLVRKSEGNENLEILHASISCKWTLRSDRSQNTRAEGLNLIRNRKGRLPHILVVTAEPLPTRIASLALGTGDIDCVYHFALNELEDTVRNSIFEGQIDMLNTLINGNRLRDISDLIFDLLI
jgi:hypothetical protein